MTEHGPWAWWDDLTEINIDAVAYPTLGAAMHEAAGYVEDCKVRARGARRERREVCDEHEGHDMEYVPDHPCLIEREVWVIPVVCDD